MSVKDMAKRLSVESEWYRARYRYLKDSTLKPCLVANHKSVVRSPFDYIRY